MQLGKNDVDLSLDRKSNDYHSQSKDSNSTLILELINAGKNYKVIEDDNTKMHL